MAKSSAGYRVDVTCPNGECGHVMQAHVKWHAGEKMTRDYPGSPPEREILSAPEACPACKTAIGADHINRAADMHDAEYAHSQELDKALAELDALTDKLNKADSFLPGQVEMFGDAPPPPKPKKGKKSAATPAAHSGAAEAHAIVAAKVKAAIESIRGSH